MNQGNPLVPRPRKHEKTCVHVHIFANKLNLVILMFILKNTFQYLANKKKNLKAVNWWQIYIFFKFFKTYFLDHPNWKWVIPMTTKIKLYFFDELWVSSTTSFRMTANVSWKFFRDFSILFVYVFFYFVLNIVKKLHHSLHLLQSLADFFFQESIDYFFLLRPDYARDDSRKKNQDGLLTESQSNLWFFWEKTRKICFDEY